MKSYTFKKYRKRRNKTLRGGGFEHDYTDLTIESAINTLIKQDTDQHYIDAAKKLVFEQDTVKTMGLVLLLLRIAANKYRSLNNDIFEGENILGILSEGLTGGHLLLAVNNIISYYEHLGIKIPHDLRETTRRNLKKEYAVTAGGAASAPLTRPAVRLLQIPFISFLTSFAITPATQKDIGDGLTRLAGIAIDTRIGQKIISSAATSSTETALVFCFLNMRNQTIRVANIALAHAKDPTTLGLGAIAVGLGVLMISGRKIINDTSIKKILAQLELSDPLPPPRTLSLANAASLPLPKSPRADSNEE